MSLISRLIFLLACIPAWANADPSTLRAANELLKTGQPEKAVQMLQPLSADEKDNAEYNYLLGIAHLDAGHLSEAISALKRSLALKPDLLQAKAELGRAYVLNGEAINAYLVFNEVRAGNPPPEVLAGMERFIGTMAQGANAQKKISGSLTATLGYDTNVNSGTSATSVTLPLFGGVPATLGANANPRKDAFLAIGGNVTARHDLSDTTELVGTFAANGKYNAKDENRSVDNEQIDVSVGLRKTQGKDQYSLTGLYEQFDYGHDALRSEAGLELGWRRLTNGPLELAFSYRHSELDYPNASPRNARRDVLILAVLPSFFGRRLQEAPTLGSFYIGEERPKDAASDNLGYWMWGVRAAYVDRIQPKTAWFVSGGYEQRQYGAADPLFLTTQKDHRIDLTAGLIHSLSGTLSLIPGVQWVNTDSNIVVYDNQRTLYTLTLRKLF